MAHIFLSYSHKDKAYVRKLYEDLRARGFDAWIDDRIDYGSQWPREIQRRLDKCEALILVMSQNALESIWVQNELHYAQNHGKPVFPILLGGDAWLETTILQYADVRSGKLPPEDFYARLEAVAPRSRTAPTTVAPKKETPRPVKAPPVRKPKPSLKETAIGFLAIIVIALVTWGIWGVGQAIANQPASTPTSTATRTLPAATLWPSVTSTASPTNLPPATFTPMPTYTPTPKAGDQRTRQKDGMVEVYVPASSFFMGSGISGYSEDGPAHQVTLGSFWIDQTEITNAMFANFLNQEGNQTEGGASWLDTSDPDAQIHYSGGKWLVDNGREDYPVIEITWYGARAYCYWVGGGVPTEAQWEYAARGGQPGMSYPWGNDSPVCAIGVKNGAQYSACGGKTIPVGSFAANDYGLYDVAGNVWEWVNDWYSDAYYSSAIVWVNPTGPESGSQRGVRGGAWYNGEEGLRVFTRDGHEPIDSVDWIGFRCASPAE